VRAIGPGSVNVNLSVSKTFGFGKRPGQLARTTPARRRTALPPDGQNQTGQRQSERPRRAQCRVASAGGTQALDAGAGGRAAVW